jgi:hypothetical protein
MISAVGGRVRADEVLDLFGEGVDAFCAETARLDDEAWDRPACGEWSAAQLARHVLSVVGWYHEWLDRAEAGDASAAFPIDDLDRQTARSLIDMGDLPGPEATERFRARALTYADRLPDAWDLPYGYPRGTVTAGLHAGMAAVEWHVHTWDLSPDHVPSRPDLLYVGAADCMAAALGRTADDPPPDPWSAMLERTGRL